MIQGCDGRVKGIRLLLPLAEQRFQFAADRIAGGKGILILPVAPQPQMHRAGFSGLEREQVVGRRLGARAFGIHRLDPPIDQVGVESILYVGGGVGTPAEPLTIGVVVGDQHLIRRIGSQGVDGLELPGLDLFLVAEFSPDLGALADLPLPAQVGLGTAVVFPRPDIAEPECGQQMQAALPVRRTVCDRDANADVFRAGLGIFNFDIVIMPFLKNAGIQQFVLKVVPAAPLIFLDQIPIGIGCHRILVEPTHVGVRGCTVDVKIIFFYVFAVIALVACESEIAFFQDRIMAVPEGQCKAKLLAAVTDAQDPVLAPAIGPGAGLVVGKIFPGRAVGAVVLPDCAPLAIA